MTYIIDFADNTEPVELSTIPEVKRWLKGNDYEPEDNADLWGIDETITDQGDVCIYEKGSESDWIAGRIRRA